MTVVASILGATNAEIFEKTLQTSSCWWDGCHASCVSNNDGKILLAVLLCMSLHHHRAEIGRFQFIDPYDTERSEAGDE